MASRTPEPWPDLPLAPWRSTRDALHLWTQIAGKTLLAACPPQNHWWHTALQVSPRGLRSLRASDGGLAFELEFDLLEDQLFVRTGDGRSAALPLRSGSVRDFYREYMELLAGLGIRVHVWPVPVEIPDPVPFEEDREHRVYDPAHARRFLEALQGCDAVLRAMAAGFLGKQSPVHFFWGSFDLASTRFSGRRAPERPGADPVTREAYSHEVISFGFWPGGRLPSGARVDEPILYAYQAPEPPGLRETSLRTAGAHYDEALGEFVLPYAAARAHEDPAAAVRTFFEDVYDAGAELAGWDRSTLERPDPSAARVPELGPRPAQGP